MRAAFFGVDADSARALLIATIGRAAAQHVTRAMRAAVFFSDADSARVGLIATIGRTNQHVTRGTGERVFSHVVRSVVDTTI